MWHDIERLVAGDGYMNGVARSRERVSRTAEIFTPAALVIDMVRKMPIEAFAPGKSVLDPACGDGNFLVAAKAVKMMHFGMSESDALADIYGVDIMRDNVDRAILRVGGGTIVMGDTLDPARELEGQTATEHAKMLDLFVDGRQSALF
jgi:type I restriction-modification system DNA methylase subunit